MPMAVHKIQLHGQEITEWAVLPICQLSAEVEDVGNQLLYVVRHTI